MTPFEAIQFVTSGLTLVAFLVAVAGATARSALRRKESLIKTASEQERAPLVEVALGEFRVNTETLSKSQKFSLLMTRLEHKREWLNKVYNFAVLVAILTGVLTFAWLYPAIKGEPNPETFGEWWSQG
jgi:hypothetical protein